MGWVLLTIYTCGVIFFDVAFAITQVRDWRASRFPTTTGVILGIRIAQGSLGTGSGAGNDYYRGVIRYRYTVSGRVYDSEHMRYTRDWVSLEAAQRVVNTYKIGQPIRVYYNPRNPSDAVLFPSVWDDARGWLSVLLPLNAAMVVAWIWGVRSLVNRVPRGSH